MSYFIGIDVGGTTSTVAIGNEAKEIIFLSDQFPTRSTEGPDATVKAIVAAIASGLKQCGADTASAACLATPGPATLDGILLKTPNLKAELWDRFPIRQALQDGLADAGLRTNVHYIGDGQAAALGEFAVRSGNLKPTPAMEGNIPPVTVQTDLQSIFMVIVGTGLGGGEIRDGRVVRGMKGRAGHAGHVLLPEYAFRYPHDRELVVGNAKATVESAVSLTALTHQLEYRLSLPEWENHALNAQGGSPKDKAKQLRELADAKDPLALQLFADQARALGIALLSINYLGDYDLVVIGGGVCDLSEEVRTEYRKQAEKAYLEVALDGFQDLDRFEFSACGDSAPVLGALHHALVVHES